MVYACVCVCIDTRPRCPHMHMRVLWAVFFPVYFSSPATLRLPSTTLAILSQPIHTGRESVDQWSCVPAGTVVEQIAPIADVMNATSVHSLWSTPPNPLSCPGLTHFISLWSSPNHSQVAWINNHTCVVEAHDGGQSTSIQQGMLAKNIRHPLQSVPS